MSIITLLVIILILAVIFGVFGGTRNYGYFGWSPLGIVLLLILILFLTGNLHT